MASLSLSSLALEDGEKSTTRARAPAVMRAVGQHFFRWLRYLRGAEHAPQRWRGVGVERRAGAEQLPADARMLVGQRRRGSMDQVQRFGLRAMDQRQSRIALLRRAAQGRKRAANQQRVKVAFAVLLMTQTRSGDAAWESSASRDRAHKRPCPRALGNFLSLASTLATAAVAVIGPDFGIAVWWRAAFSAAALLLSGCRTGLKPVEVERCQQLHTAAASALWPSTASSAEARRLDLACALRAEPDLSGQHVLGQKITRRWKMLAASLIRLRLVQAQDDLLRQTL